MSRNENVILFLNLKKAGVSECWKMIPKANSFFLVHIYMYKILYTKVVLLSLKNHVACVFHGVHRVQTGMNNSSLSLVSVLHWLPSIYFFLCG